MVLLTFYKVKLKEGKSENYLNRSPMDIALQFRQEEQNFITACIRKERWAQKKLYEEHYSTVSYTHLTLPTKA